MIDLRAPRTIRQGSDDVLTDRYLLRGSVENEEEMVDIEDAVPVQGAVRVDTRDPGNPRGEELALQKDVVQHVRRDSVRWTRKKTLQLKRGRPPSFSNFGLTSINRLKQRDSNHSLPAA